MEEFLFNQIQMVDLQKQYQRLSKDIDAAIQECLHTAQFIQGQKVRDFENALGQYLNSKYTISCGNGTDALMLACMALGLQRGDKVIVPAFTYIASVEVLKLLGIEPIFCDVDEHSFMPEVQHLEDVYTTECKAVIIVHLYGQCANMSAIMDWANQKNLWVIEDNAQSLGAMCKIEDEMKYAGTIGHIGTTSFFPSKNLGAFGDGGAIFTQNERWAATLRTMANHGQSQKYVHDMIGVNSRLDTLQAGILLVKLQNLEDFTQRRREVAILYNSYLSQIPSVKTPFQYTTSTHVFHQYTICLENENVRNNLQAYLKEKAIPSVVYYPLPIYKQRPYYQEKYLPNTERLCAQVLSLPMHTELSEQEIVYICDAIKLFFDARF
ncbi:MAG: DegT/DnrJ/EryC1/StrS aminotransferase family protein [Chitinophagales bacterium]|nr:DegT/DnrJ/EryC1/StrS aminotransferase family protein [Chitinophagales bacterium]